jgi:hypothetical protein
MKLRKTIAILKSKWRCLIFVFFTLVFYFGQNIWKLPAAIDYKKTSLLFPNYKIHVDVNQIKEHNGLLLDLLNQRMTISYTEVATRESSNQQMRGFYILILAGLLSIVISKLGRDSQRKIYIFMMVVITAMYFLEVHQIDLNERYKNNAQTYSENISRFVNKVQDTSTWYYFSSNDMFKQWNEASTIYNRWERWIKRAIRPKAAQVTIYFIPYTLIFWMLLPFKSRLKEQDNNDLIKSE